MARYAIERQKLSDRVVALLEDEIVRGVRPLAINFLRSGR